MKNQIQISRVSSNRLTMDQKTINGRQKEKSQTPNLKPKTCVCTECMCE